MLGSVGWLEGHIVHTLQVRGLPRTLVPGSQTCRRYIIRKALAGFRTVPDWGSCRISDATFCRRAICISESGGDVLHGSRTTSRTGCEQQTIILSSAGLSSGSDG